MSLSFWNAAHRGTKAQAGCLSSAGRVPWVAADISPEVSELTARYLGEVGWPQVFDFDIAVSVRHASLGMTAVDVDELAPCLELHISESGCCDTVRPVESYMARPAPHVQEGIDRNTRSPRRL